MANEKKSGAKKLGRKNLKPIAPQQLRLTMVGPYRVSTVNLDAIPGFGRSLVALTDTLLGSRGGSFETMVFYGDKSHDLEAKRYFSESDALAGHETMVEKWMTRTEGK